MRITFVENYKNMSDDEIVTEINSGNYELMQVIIERYYPVILFNVRTFCPQQYQEDAIQEANIALYTAVKDFDSEKSAFSTFASLCIKRSVQSVLKAHRCKKNIPDELVDPIDELELIDTNSPEKIFFEKQNYESLTTDIRLELSALEYKVLQLHLSGAKYADIASALGISEKAVDNSLSRVRKKLKNK